MLKLFASFLLISTTLSYPVTDSSERWLEELLRRSKRKAEFGPYLLVQMETPATFTVSLGSSSQFLECKASGLPAPTVHWLKDGQRLSQSELNYSDVESSLGLNTIKSRLYLDDVTSDQAGEYTCVAKNTYFSKNKTSRVVVTDGNQENRTANRNGEAARITVWTSSMLELQGVDVRLHCRSEGSPSPTVSWFQPEGKKIEDTEKYKVKENGDLVIKSLVWSDMGFYACESENAGGMDSAGTFVYPVKPE